MIDDESDRRVQVKLAGLNEVQLEHYAQRLAVLNHYSIEDARRYVEMGRSGQLFPEIERLETDLARLHDEHAEISSRIKALRSNQSIYIPPDRPWMTAIEMQFAALRSCSSWRRDATRPGLVLSHDFDRRRLVPLLEAAETYSWSAETVTAVRMAAETVPLDTEIDRSQLPSRAGWWWFHGPFDLEAEPDLVALLWGPGKNDQLWVSGFVMLRDAGEWMLDQGFSFAWEFGTTIADQLRSKFLGDDNDTQMDRETQSIMSRFFVAACAWLKQRVLSSNPGRVERHRRKQLSRELGIAVLPSVQVIQLRRMESANQDGVQGSQTVDWSCRWVVSGHWRNQPYANGERKLIYIMPFVKGPADKPLREHSTRVYAVNR